MVGISRSRLLKLMPGLFLASLLLIFPDSIAQGQDYSFSVDSKLVSIYIQEDSSIDIVYDITFTCDPGAHPIDIVDVGLPNDHYDLSSATATIDDQPVSRISKSEWLDTGVEVHLGANRIMPGETGTLHLEMNNPQMVYQDSQDEEYASVRFYPHYYEGTGHGITDLRLSIYFPPGVQPDETRYHDQEFTEADMEGDRPVMTWAIPNARADQQYQFGVSFPKQYVRKVFTHPGEDVREVFTQPTAGLAPLVRGLFIVLLALVRFLETGGWLLVIIFVFVTALVIGFVRRNRRLMDYMPPLLSVEGMGVKRGLTAVEAAVMLEAPANKALTMILFGLVKKGAVRVVSQEPLRLEKAEQLPKLLHPYENDFLTAIKSKGGLKEKQLKKTMIGLVKVVHQKMKGFHAKDTIAYYKDIVARAWKQVEAADTPEVLDYYLEWVMADEDFDEKMPQTFGTQPIPVPVWWWMWAGAGRPTGTPRPSAGTAAPSAAGPRTIPGAQFANTIVSRIESISNTIVTNVAGFTAGVTQTTHPVPVSRSSGRIGGGWSGGGGCACACACAGCACACAGGGR